MHIGLKICHFLLSVVSITEGPKNKIMRKSAIHSFVPCRDSTFEQLVRLVSLSTLAITRATNLLGKNLDDLKTEDN